MGFISSLFKKPIFRSFSIKWPNLLLYSFTITGPSSARANLFKRTPSIKCLSSTPLEPIKVLSPTYKIFKQDPFPLRFYRRRHNPSTSKLHTCSLSTHTKLTFFYFSISHGDSTHMDSEKTRFTS